MPDCGKTGRLIGFADDRLTSILVYGLQAVRNMLLQQGYRTPWTDWSDYSPDPEINLTWVDRLSSWWWKLTSGSGSGRYSLSDCVIILACSGPTNMHLLNAVGFSVRSTAPPLPLTWQTWQKNLVLVLEAEKNLGKSSLMPLGNAFISRIWTDNHLLYSCSDLKRKRETSGFSSDSLCALLKIRISSSARNMKTQKRNVALFSTIASRHFSRCSSSRNYSDTSAKA